MARSSERISFRSSCVAGRRSSKASAIRSRSDSAPAPAPRTISSTASCARSRPICADPTVAWIVRSTASRTASGTCWLGRLAIAPGVSHIVRRMLDSGPIHLKPAAELAERVLLPGDPHRALAVAQALLEQPKMFNHHRGLGGYTGPACGGRAVTAGSTDLCYDRREGVEQSWAKRGAAVVEMEAATLFQAALVHRVRAGCALGVSDVIGDGRRRIGHEQLAELGVRLGEV